MTFHVTIGIDPGATGAVGALVDGEYSNCCDMPTTARKAGGQQVNGAELAYWIGGARVVHRGATFTVILEATAARPGQGVSSMYRFGESVGIVRGVVAALRLPLLVVQPQTWKKWAGLIGAEKDVARTVASQRFPAAPLTRKKDVGRADALLIAAWGYATEAQARAA